MPVEIEITDPNGEVPIPVEFTVSGTYTMNDSVVATAVKAASGMIAGAIVGDDTAPPPILTGTITVTIFQSDGVTLLDDLDANPKTIPDVEAGTDVSWSIPFKYNRNHYDDCQIHVLLEPSSGASDDDRVIEVDIDINGGTP